MASSLQGLVWLTYRAETHDASWSCTLRSTQMLLARSIFLASSPGDEAAEQRVLNELA